MSAPRSLRLALPAPEPRTALVAESAAMREVVRRIDAVARTDSTVLLQGATGTGKELIARAVHDASARAGAPFVRLNVAAVPANLLESELFGHERGAFTGAFARRLGRFEEARGGTILLDEIGELHPDLQPKLLRLLEEREFQRIGGAELLRAEVRVLAATNRDLRSLVAAGAFRADLFYRLNVLPIHVPPLRDRAEDLRPLVRQLLVELTRELGQPRREPPAEVWAALERHDWPGNVRELRNVLERALILSRDGKLALEFDAEDSPRSATRPVDSLDAATRTHLVRVLEECRWVIAGPGGAAERLGVKRTTLNARLKKLGIERPRTS